MTPASNAEPSHGFPAKSATKVQAAPIKRQSHQKRKHSWAWRALLVAFGLLSSVWATAQPFRTLYSFTAISDTAPYTNTDGSESHAELILSGNTLYGTASRGGISGSGTVFRVNVDGTGFTNLHSFTGGSDGSAPLGRLVLSGSALYGTTAGGGSPDGGTLFAVNTDGTGFTNLYSFTPTSDVSPYTNSDGANPWGGMVLSGATLYGTTIAGGASSAGTVFAIKTDGSGFTNLHSFLGPDGRQPRAELVLSSNTLYGTTQSGGSAGRGTIFALSTDGTGFTNLHVFTRTGFNNTNSDGVSPIGRLVLSENILYGTAANGGALAAGTVYAVHTDGTGFANLHNFTPSFGLSNIDGSGPSGGLTLSGRTLYGTAGLGGSSGRGTVFALSTDGISFATQYSFTTTYGSTGGSGTNNDGAYPASGLLLAGGNLYGTTTKGGSSGAGTLFSLFFPPQLTIAPLGTNLILTWPAAALGFTLQSTTNLDSSATWISNSPAPVVLNGLNTVTNSASEIRQFFRLTN